MIKVKKEIEEKKEMMVQKETKEQGVEKEIKVT